VALVVGHGVDLVTRVISVLPTIYAL
jgi:hypothetical protein